MRAALSKPPAAMTTPRSFLVASLAGGAGSLAPPALPSLS